MDKRFLHKGSLFLKRQKRILVIYSNPTTIYILLNSLLEGEYTSYSGQLLLTVLPTYTQQHQLFSCRNCVKCASSLFINQRLHKTTSCESFFFFFNWVVYYMHLNNQHFQVHQNMCCHISTVHRSHPPELLHLYKSSLVPSHRCTTRR